MSDVKTPVHPFKDDVGKNLYRKKTYYTVCIEQDVLAKDKDEADEKFRDFGGLDYNKINTDNTNNKAAIKITKLILTLNFW